MTGQGWSAWSTAGPLGADEVRCVRFALEPQAPRFAQLRALLSPDERARADRFLKDVHRRRFAAARGFLRELLAAHSGVPAAKLRFAYAERGKPRLAFPSTELRFNLSHSGNLALAAVARGLELGVDVEQIRERVNLSGIARRFFAEAETTDLLARPEPERRLAFFRCWTRKEAFLKAKGGGLSLPLDGFTVTLGADEDAALVAVAWDPGEARRWELRAFCPAAGYAGALVVAKRPGLRVTTFDWT